MDTVPPSTPSLTPDPPADPRLEQLSRRLLEALATAYATLDRARLPWGAQPILALLRPRLEASLAADPARAAAILTWAWAKIPELIGDTVDLGDADRVAAIVERVEQVEGFGRE